MPSSTNRGIPKEAITLVLNGFKASKPLQALKMTGIQPGKKIKGPDNPTYQLLPTSSKRKVKMAWGKQEREKRWCRIGVEQVVCGRVSVSTLCGDKLCVMCVCVRAEVVTGKEGKTKEVVKRFEKYKLLCGIYMYAGIYVSAACAFFPQNMILKLSDVM